MPGRVLVVVPEEYLRSFLHRVLSRHGYAVSAVATAPAALDATPADLAILKTRLADMDSAELVRRLQAVTPRLNALFISGAATGASKDLRDAAFLQMPFGIAELLEALGELSHSENGG